MRFGFPRNGHEMEDYHSFLMGGSKIFDFFTIFSLKIIQE
jgi:hypothetical protein